MCFCIARSAPAMCLLLGVPRLESETTSSKLSVGPLTGAKFLTRKDRILRKNSLAFSLRGSPSYMYSSEPALRVADATDPANQDEKTYPAADPRAHTCERQKSRAAPVSGSPAAAPNGMSRSRQVRNKTSALARPEPHNTRSHDASASVGGRSQS